MAPFSTPTSRSLQPVVPLPPESVVFGRSETMREVQATLEKGAHTNVPVLLHGESGTGKELLARVIHQMSPWSSGPFLKVNCPAMPRTFFDSATELFGFGRGPYGLESERVEMVHRGTLFLDEISELDIPLQSKLIDFLQDGHCWQVGTNRNLYVEARVVCASNRRLEEEIAKGSFRQDLFYRLNVINVRVPPLRERTADIPVLATYFYELFRDQYDSSAKPPSEQLLKLLMSHHWRGNVRELENLMKRYVILGTEAAVSAELVPAQSPAVAAPVIVLDRPISLKEITRAAVRDVERQVILKILQANQWNRRRAAQALSISYRALLYKMKGVAIASPPSNGKGATAHDD